MKKLLNESWFPVGVIRQHVEHLGAERAAVLTDSASVGVVTAFELMPWILLTRHLVHELRPGGGFRFLQRRALTTDESVVGECFNERGLVVPAFTTQYEPATAALD